MKVNRKKFESMSNEERLGLVNRIHIETNETKRISAIIKKCHCSYHRIGQPNHVFICGNTGAGKTTICERYAKQHKRLETEEDDKVPVLYVKAPTPATIKGLASKLLDALGDPKPDKGSTETITFRLKKMLKKCCVELIIMDEFQHLTDNKTDNAIKQTSNWLKLLIEEANIPIVLIGLPESDTIFLLNPQLSRRFSRRCTLEPFRWANEIDRTNFKKLLNKFDKMLPFPEDSKLGYGDMPDRFHYASDGVIAYVVQLLRFAAEDAIEKELKNINRFNLEKVYDEQIAFEKPGKSDNPFSLEKFNYKYEKITEKQYHQHGGMNNRIPAKKKKDGIADIF